MIEGACGFLVRQAWIRTFLIWQAEILARLDDWIHTFLIWQAEILAHLDDFGITSDIAHGKVAISASSHSNQRVIT